MENIVVPAQKRAHTRTKGATEVRRNGLIPAVVYGGDTPENVTVNLHDVRHAVYTPDFKRVELDIEGTKVPCILKDVQYHPVTDAIIHLDFLRLSQGTKVKVDVPLRFIGLSVGLKAGGKLIQKLRRIKIQATPDKLIHEIALDVTDLQLGQSIRIRDIKLGEGIEILNSPGIPVVSVGIPRALKGPEETPAAGAAVTPAAGTPAAPTTPAAPGAKGAAPATPEAPAKKEPAKKEPAAKKEGGKK
jgi:large subunit ribosomal protein L25